ncbi:MAG: SDR family oxidoreductase [Patulibacter sp.]|nr:SDR family oxidoreductase [Patulibacter sp.]
MSTGLVAGRAGIVTGAAGGMGRATAVRFGAEGASVVVTDLEAQHANVEQTVRLVEQAGGRAIFIPADVTREDDHRRLVDGCVGAYGRLDFAHNNAGADHQGTVENTTVEDFDRVIGVNLKGVWLGMKHQLARMRSDGNGGSIVNTASLGALMAIPNLAVYIASKHAVIGITKAAALEAADAGIRVNAICPSTTRTPMLDHLDEQRIEQIVRPHAIKRLCEPDEVAAAVVWLASDQASLVTGVPFRIDLGAGAGIAT